MGVITLRCDHCGGEIQLDDGREFGFCMYCGTKIVIRQDTINITMDAAKQVENLKRLMRAHHAAGNRRDAGEIADRIIEINGADAETWFVKAMAIASGEEFSLGSRELEACVRNYSALSGAPFADAKSFLAANAPELLASVLSRQAYDIFIRRRGRDYGDLGARASEIVRLDPSNPEGLRLMALADLALRGPDASDSVGRARDADPEGWSRDLPAILDSALRGPGCDPSYILGLARSEGAATDVLCIMVLEAASRRRDASAVDAALSALGRSVVGITDMSRIGMGPDATYSFGITARQATAMGALMKLAFRKTEDVESFMVTVDGLLDGDRILSEYVYGGESPEGTRPFPVSGILSKAVSVTVRTLDGTTAHIPVVIMGCMRDSGNCEVLIERRGDSAGIDLPSLGQAFDLVLLDEALGDSLRGW